VNLFLSNARNESNFQIKLEAILSTARVSKHMPLALPFATLQIDFLYVRGRPLAVSETVGIIKIMPWLEGYKDFFGRECERNSAGNENNALAFDVFFTVNPSFLLSCFACFRKVFFFPSGLIGMDLRVIESIML
jgi:hypothetical protein